MPKYQESSSEDEEVEMKNQSAHTADNSRWEALKKRDMAATGGFLYAVKTTKIFCRPGCPSRLPKRENIEFFFSSLEAKQSGYRPCKRCFPDQLC